MKTDFVYEEYQEMLRLLRSLFFYFRYDADPDFSPERKAWISQRVADLFSEIIKEKPSLNLHTLEQVMSAEFITWMQIVTESETLQEAVDLYHKTIGPEVIFSNARLFRQ